MIDNYFVKLVTHSRREPAICETVYYNRDLSSMMLFRYMWLFDRYAAIVTMARPDLYVEKIVGNIEQWDEEDYCNKIRRNKLSAAKSRVTRIDREGFIPDLFGENEKAFRQKLNEAKQVLRMWEGDGWKCVIDLPTRYINKIREYETLDKKC